MPSTCLPRCRALALLITLLIVSSVRAELRNPHTDWFQEAGCGVFVHYLGGLQNNREALHSFGRETSWDECVQEFDTERFADTVPVRRIKVTFGSGYATQFEFQLSTDRQTWHTVAEKGNHDGTPFEAEFNPVTARYVRVCASKPDAPDQEGGTNVCG